jgi:hypothetical protein
MQILTQAHYYSSELLLNAIPAMKPTSPSFLYFIIFKMKNIGAYHQGLMALPV